MILNVVFEQRKCYIIYLVKLLVGDEELLLVLLQVLLEALDATVERVDLQLSGEQGLLLLFELLGGGEELLGGLVEVHLQLLGLLDEVGHLLLSLLSPDLLVQQKRKMTN